MSIGNCKLTFSELASQVLPVHMERLRQAILKPYQMELFGRKGIGPSNILENFGHRKDFTGCYVLLQNAAPVYVGISRTVVQRLCQHVKGRTHYDASLAYRIASDNIPHGLKRDAAMKNPAFKREFERAQDYLKSLQVAFIEIQNDLELYLFEVYCTMELKTFKWNTFRTH